MTATLAQLVAVRSQFGAELDAYLAQVGAGQAAAISFFPHGFDPSTIRQRVLVRRERLRYDDAEARRQEVERREAFADETEPGDRLERAYARHASDEDDEEAKSEIVDWERLRGSLRRGVILGDPGYGKTFLLRHEARRLAAAYVSTSQPEPPFPILLRLADMTAQLKDAKGDPVQAIAAAAQTRYYLTDRFTAWLAGRIPAPNTVLLLDALDEVPATLRADLRDALGRLATATQGTILLASRIVGYGGAPFPVRQDERSREVELVAFDPPRIANFIKGWFAAAPDKGRVLQAHLRRQPTLRSLARTPLLLTFLCLVAGDNRPLPAIRSGLYDRVLRLLLAGAWRAEELREQTPARIPRKLRLLQGVAWHFATQRGAWRDLLPGDELEDLLEAAPEAAFLWQTAPTPPIGAGGGYRGLLAELSERDGIFVAAGAGAPGEAVPYLFLHRTLHEYLVAKHLAAQPAAVWQAQVQAVGVFDADWSEALVLLVGCLDDPNPLITELLDAEDDPFHQRHFLAARCIGEVDADCVDNATVQALVDYLTPVLRSAAGVDRTLAGRGLAEQGEPGLPSLTAALTAPDADVRFAAAKALGALDDPAAISALVHALADPDWGVQRAATISLGQIGAPALPALTAALANPDIPAGARAAAVEALGQIGDSTILPALTRALSDMNTKVRHHAVKILGKLSDLVLSDLVLSALAHALSDSQRWVRLGAVEALKELGNPITIPLLAHALSDSFWNVRDVATDALGRLGHSALPYLAQALSDPDSIVRGTAVEALGELGGPAVISPLTQALSDSDGFVRIVAEIALDRISQPVLVDSNVEARVAAAVRSLSNPKARVRRTAVEALREVGGPAVISPLTQALTDPDPTVCESAAKALGELGDPIGLPALVHALTDPDEIMRDDIAKIMGDLGDPTVIPVLTYVLNDSDELVRYAAANALGSLIASDHFAFVASALFQQWATFTDRVSVYPLLRRLAWRMKSPVPLQPVVQAATDLVLAQGLAETSAYRCQAKTIFARLAAQFPDDAVVATELARLTEASGGDLA